MSLRRVSTVVLGLVLAQVLAAAGWVAYVVYWGAEGARDTSGWTFSVLALPVLGLVAWTVIRSIPGRPISFPATVAGVAAELLVVAALVPSVLLPVSLALGLVVGTLLIGGLVRSTTGAAPQTLRH